MVEEQLGTRAFLSFPDESAELTEAILAEQARRATSLAPPKHPRESDIRAALALLRPAPVIIPFAPKVRNLFPKDRPPLRLRRDHARFLLLVETVAWFHQFQRPRVDTPSGPAIVASELDLRIARHLMEPYFRSTVHGIDPTGERILEALAEGTETSREIAILTGLAQRTVQRHLEALEEVGRAVRDDSKRPHRWAPARDAQTHGDPSPNDASRRVGRVVDAPDASRRPEKPLIGDTSRVPEEDGRDVAPCGWCGKVGSLLPSGFCRGCDTNVRGDEE